MDPARLAWGMVVVAALVAGCAKPRASMPIAPGPGWEEMGRASWYGVPYHGRRTASGEIYDMHQMTAAHRTLPFGTWLAVEHVGTARSTEVRVNDRGPFVDGRILDLSYAAARTLDAIGPGVIPVRLRIIDPPGAAATRTAPMTATAAPATTTTAPAATTTSTTAPNTATTASTMATTASTAATAASTTTAPVSTSIAVSATAAAGGGRATFAVQLGAFVDDERARQLQREVEGLGWEARVEPTTSDDLVLYRVRVGRFADRRGAAAAVRELTASGRPAIVVQE